MSVIDSGLTMRAVRFEEARAEALEVLESLVCKPGAGFILSVGRVEEDGRYAVETVKLIDSLVLGPFASNLRLEAKELGKAAEAYPNV